MTTRRATGAWTAEHRSTAQGDCNPSMVGGATDHVDTRIPHFGLASTHRGPNSACEPIIASILELCRSVFCEPLLVFGDLEPYQHFLKLQYQIQPSLILDHGADKR